MNRYYNIILVFLLVLGFFTTVSISSAQNDNIDYFYMPGCSACAQMKPFLEDLQEKYDISLNIYETSKSSNLFTQKLEEYNVPANRRGYVPAVFIGEKYFIGFSPEIAEAIENILQGKNISQENNLIGEIVKTRVLGLWDVEVSMNNRSLLVAGLLLAFLDSINVCSITVLVFLIIYSLSVGSVKRAFKIGIVFTSIIFIFYAVFMILLTGVLGLFVTNYNTHIRIAVIVISVLAGLILIKDFFWYGKGISLAIPKSAKPILERYIKQATIGSTILLAIFASLVELPCTAIFPLIYTTMLASAGSVGLQRISYILIYNLIYIWPLLFIVFGTYFSWSKIENIDERIQKSKGIMRLVAGGALLLVALYFAWPLIF
jgi:hypothetical protein